MAPPEKSRADQILGVATDLFFSKGYGHVGVDEIGLAVGLTGPAIYRHFKGKGELLAALFDQALDGLLVTTAGSLSDPHEELRYKVSAHARFVMENYKLASIWVSEVSSLSTLHRDRLRRRENNYIEQWCDTVARSYPKLSPAQARIATLTAVGTLNSIPSWTTTGATEAMETAAVAFVLSGIARLGCGDWTIELAYV